MPIALTWADIGLRIVLTTLAAAAMGPSASAGRDCSRVMMRTTPSRKPTKSGTEKHRDSVVTLYQGVSAFSPANEEPLSDAVEA